MRKLSIFTFFCTLNNYYLGWYGYPATSQRLAMACRLPGGRLRRLHVAAGTVNNIFSHSKIFCASVFLPKIFHLVLSFENVIVLTMNPPLKSQTDVEPRGCVGESGEGHQPRLCRPLAGGDHREVRPYILVNKSYKSLKMIEYKLIFLN